MSTEAVLVLDMTRDSIAPQARAVEKRRAILPQTAAYLNWARGKGMPVLRSIAADYGVSVRTLWRWAKYDVREVQVGKYRALFVSTVPHPLVKTAR